MNEFGRLLEKEIPRLRRYAFALTRNISRADDLVQDTLVRAIAKQRCWQWGTNLRAWLFTLMHNQNVNGVRCSAREDTAVGVRRSVAIPHSGNRSGGVATPTENGRRPARILASRSVVDW